MPFDQLRYGAACPQRIRHLELIRRFVANQAADLTFLLAGEPASFASLASANRVLQGFRPTFRMPWVFRPIVTSDSGLS
jgi:hypothetical protein